MGAGKMGLGGGVRVGFLRSIQCGGGFWALATRLLGHGWVPGGAAASHGGAAEGLRVGACGGGGQGFIGEDEAWEILLGKSN